MIPAARLTPYRRWFPLLGWSGLTITLGASCLYSSQTAFPGVAVCLPVLGTLAILVFCGSGEHIALMRFLGSAPLQYLGKLSYSWYLWHWPVLLMAELRFPGITWKGRLLAAAFALLLANLTFVLLERPVRFHPFLAPRPALSLALVVLVAAIGVSTGHFVETRARRALASVPQSQFWAAANDDRVLFDAHCLTPAGRTRLAQCVYGDRASTNTVVLFGDSHAEHWFPALEQIAIEKHWRLVTMLKSSCPVARLNVYNVVLKRTDTECSEWREKALDQIAQLQPSLVVISEKDGVVSRDGSEARRHAVSPEEWQRGLHATVAYLDARRVRSVVLTDVPRAGSDLPICLSRAAAYDWATQDCSISRSAALNEVARQAEQAAISGLQYAKLVDFADEFCTGSRCRPLINGQIVFRDSNHMTSGFARSLAPALEREIESFTADRKPESLTARVTLPQN